MAGVLTTKVRLVRCPRCKLLLPELPDFNVYKCGGCGATLIAKHSFNIPNPSENRSDRSSEEKEEHHRSSNKDVAPCSGECSSSQNDESDRSKSGDCDGLNFPRKYASNNTAAADNGIRRRSDASDFYNEGSEISSEVYSPTEFFDDKSEDFARNQASDPANEDLSGSEFDLFGNNENGGIPRNENDESSHDENENEEERFRAEAENEPSMSLALAIADVVEPGADLGRLSIAEKAVTEDTINKKSDSGYDYDYDYDYEQPPSSDHRGYSRNQSHELRGDYFGQTSSKSPARLPHAYGGTGIYDEETNIRREKFMAQAMMRNSWLDKNNSNNAPTSRNWRPEREREHQMAAGYEKFQRHSSFQSHFSEDPENVVKLLKMVLQVQKQSTKSGSLYETGPSQKPMYEYDPRYHHHHNFEALQPDHHRHHYNYHHQFGYTEEDPRNLGRYASGSNYTNRPRPRKIPFSDQLDPACSHCFPKERSHHYNNPSRLHPGPRAPKRHFRPVAHGAPFVVCHRCRNVLLLPADFLLFKRKRHHRLRCGACSQILEFSLEKGSRIFGIAPKLAAPPPPPSSLVEPPSSSPMTQSQTPRDSVDYGRSNNPRRSFSAEEEDQGQGPSTPAPTPLGRAFDRIIFGVSYPPEDGSSEFPEPSRGSRYKDRPPRPESSRPTSKITKPRVHDDDDDDGDQRSTSPLHRLMGYSSPSQVIYGSRPYGVEGTSNSFAIRREQY